MFIINNYVNSTNDGYLQNYVPAKNIYSENKTIKIMSSLNPLGRHLISRLTSNFDDRMAF